MFVASISKTTLFNGVFTKIECVCACIKTILSALVKCSFISSTTFYNTWAKHVHVSPDPSISSAPRWQLWTGYRRLLPIVHRAMVCGQKSFKLVWWHYHFLFGFLAKVHLSMCHFNHLPVNDQDDNEMIPGAGHRFLGIYLTAEENLS